MGKKDIERNDSTWEFFASWLNGIRVVSEWDVCGVLAWNAVSFQFSGGEGVHVNEYPQNKTYGYF